MYLSHIIPLIISYFKSENINHNIHEIDFSLYIVESNGTRAQENWKNKKNRYSILRVSPHQIHRIINRTQCDANSLLCVYRSSMNHYSN